MYGLVDSTRSMSASGRKRTILDSLSGAGLVNRGVKRPLRP